MKIGIAADDLTSATDGAVPFLAGGHNCEVWFDHELAPELLSGVMSINKNSRAASVEDAIEKARSAAAKLADVDVLYHTIDSTIRGHLEAEVLTAREASGRKVVLFAPAFPEAGRTTINGEQLLDGVAVSQTLYAQDPVHPVKESLIRNHFPSLPDAAIRQLGLEDIRNLRPDSLELSSQTLIICDVERQDDLDRLVAAIKYPREVLFCGSPGMARALAKRFTTTEFEKPLIEKPAATCVLTVVGSVNEASLVQKQILFDESYATDIVIDANLASTSPEAAAHAALGKTELSGKKSIVIGTSAFEGKTLSAANINFSLGIAAVSIINALQVDGLVLTGGDTADAVFKALDVQSIKLTGELEPGIPVGLVNIPRQITVITKAGGFGHGRTLLNAARFLRSDSRTRNVTLQTTRAAL